MTILDIKKNVSLKDRNTFKLGVLTKYFVEAKEESGVFNVLSIPKLAKQKLLVLGAGANIIFSKDYEGLVMHMGISGVKVIKEDSEGVVLEVGAGEDWHEVVSYCVKKGWGGIENLALIPGTVGAAPVQNIGAYGQNFSDVFVSLDAIRVRDLKKKVFDAKACKFEYRNSFFKKIPPNDFVITKVRFRLKKNPDLETSYYETGKSYKRNISLKQELERIAEEPYGVDDVFNAVVSIRSKKMPDINKVGSAGSVFKNPVVSSKKYRELKEEDAELQCYPVEDLRYKSISDVEKAEFVKIPAGRLLDNLGYRGLRVGDAGVSENHALVLVNYGNATPEQILGIVDRMRKDVLDKYNIGLEPEVLVV